MFNEYFYMSNSGILSTPDNTGAYIKVSEDNNIYCSSPIITPNGTINKHGILVDSNNLQELLISASNDKSYGAFISLKRLLDPSLSGGFVLAAINENSDAITNTKLIGRNNGELEWNGYGICPLMQLSDKCVDYEIGANGSTYISPATGVWELSSLHAKQLQMYNKSCNSIWYSNEDSAGDGGYGNRSVITPVRQGDVIQIYYTANSFRNFRFHYSLYSKLLTTS